MSALRAAARCKPVLLIKVGRHPAGEKAIRSHTGALVGADDVFETILLSKPFAKATCFRHKMVSFDGFSVQIGGTMAVRVLRIRE